MSVGLQIKKLCWEHNMMQKDLADRVGISAPSLSLYTNGYVYPRVNVLKDIADVFGITDMNYFWEE